MACDNSFPPTIASLEELEKKSNKTIEFPLLAPLTGNTVAVFTMLVLQEILEQLALDPITNITTIIQISLSIASLNNSMKIIQ